MKLDSKLIYFIIFFTTLLFTVLAVKFSSAVQGWVCPYKAPCNKCPDKAPCNCPVAAAKKAKAKSESDN